VIAAIIACAMFFLPVGDTDRIDSGFGVWKLEVTGIDSDGNEIPFTVKNTLSTLSFSYNGEPVNSVRYKLYARATGSGYTSCELDYSDVECDGILFQKNAGTSGYRKIWQDQYGDSSHLITVNGDYDDIFTRSYGISSLSDAPEGDYTLQMRFMGDVRYRGISSSETGDWATETIDFDSRIDLVNEGEETPDDPPEEPDPEDTNEYNIIVATGPTAVRVTCDYGDGYDFYYGYPQTEEKNGNPVIFQRRSGTYTLHAYWADGYDETKTVSINGEGKTVTMMYGNKIEIVNTLFSVIASSNPTSYQSSSEYYLGG